MINRNLNNLINGVYDSPKEHSYTFAKQKNLNNYINKEKKLKLIKWISSK